MAMWIKCKTPGVRFRKHGTRKHGVKFDQYFSIRYRVNGKQKEEGLGWASEGWTESKAAATLAELKANKTVGRGPMTLSEKRQQEQAKRKGEAAKQKSLEQEKNRLSLTLMDKVFSSYCADNSHKQSLKAEKSCYENWVQPSLGQKRLDEIVLLDLERVRKNMSKAGKSARSIQYIKAIIRQLFNYAIERDLYSGTIPTKYFLKKQKIDNRRQRYLSPEDADILLEKIREVSEQTYRICLLSLNTGMRFGEIASLQWHHVNTVQRSITVLDPKNGETRNVYMTDIILDMFKSMDAGPPTDLVFPSKRGGKMQSISKTFARSVETLGFNHDITDRRMKVVFHTLRHSWASWMVNAGIEVPVIAKILGHKSLVMTMRYSHVNDTSVRNAMQVLDQQQSRSSEKVLGITPGS